MSGDVSYEGLLQQVTVVNQQLQEARTVISNFKKENAELESNFDTCRTALEELRVKYNATKEDLLAATERQMRTDQKNEAFQEEVLSQMASREEALRELQAQLVPQDLDLIKIQLQEELEVPQRQKLGELEGEVLKWETLYYSVRRVYEKEKTENDLFKEQVKAAIDSDRAVFEAEVASLTGQLREPQDRTSSLSLDESLLEAQASFTQSQLRENQLKAEIDDLRRDLGDSEAARAAEGSKAVELLAAAQADVAGAKADLHAAEQRTLEAQAGAAALKAEAEGLREALSEKSLEVSRRGEKLAGAEKGVREMERRVEREAERSRLAAEAEAKKLEDRLKFQLEEAKREKEAAEVERIGCRERVERALRSEEAARVDARQQIEGVEAQLAKALAGEAEARAELKSVAHAAAEGKRAKDDELNAAEAQAHKMAKELELLRLKVAKQGEEIASEKRALEQAEKVRKDTEDKVRTLADALSKMEMKATESGQAEQVSWGV